MPITFYQSLLFMSRCRIAVLEFYYLSTKAPACSCDNDNFSSEAQLFTSGIDRRVYVVMDGLRKLQRSRKEVGRELGEIHFNSRR